MSVKKIRWLIVILLLLAIIAIVVTIAKRKGYGITYQVSASMPKGFYLVVPAKKINRGDIVVFYPQKKIDDFLLSNYWVPTTGILMKQVLGMTGDMVCKRKNAIFVNNKKVGAVYKFYAPHKLLPNYPFCGTLKPDEYLLLSTKVKKSFDGRYFGPVKRKQIIGKAFKIIAR